MKQKLLILLAVLMTMFSTYAYDFKVDGIYYNILSTSNSSLEVEVTYLNTNYYSYSGNVYIPSTVSYNGAIYTVTSIGDYAFYKSYITSVNIPNSVTTIGFKAFSSCHQLNSVELPSSLLYIGKSAFSGCWELTTLEIPNSVSIIDGQAFSNCFGLISVSIGNSVTSIGYSAFELCTNLISINIPESVIELGNSIFSGCSSLTSVEIPNSVVSIKDYTFNGCINLTSVKIPNSVNTIGDSSFKDCISLLSVNIPNSVTSIGQRAFYNCNLSLVYASWTNPIEIKDLGDEVFTDPQNIILYVPIGTKENYLSCAPWYNFKEIKEYMPGGSGGDEQCDAPMISIDNNNLVITSSTPGAKYYYTIDCEDTHTLTNTEDGIIGLNGTYRISAYAYADGYNHSDIVTATLVWVNPQIEGAGVVSMEAKKAVLIKSVGGNIQLCGTELGESIQLYSIDGKLLNNTKAADGETTIRYNMQIGQTYIIRYGDKAIKYRY